MAYPRTDFGSTSDYKASICNLLNGHSDTAIQYFPVFKDPFPFYFPSLIRFD